MLGTNHNANISNISLYHIPLFTPSDLQNMEANVGPDRAVVGMRLLVRVHVKQADSSVSFQAAFLTEDQQGTRSTDLQVTR